MAESDGEIDTDDRDAFSASGPDDEVAQFERRTLLQPILDVFQVGLRALSERCGLW
jgi:hypothetical protein